MGLHLGPLSRGIELEQAAEERAGMKDSGGHLR